MRRTNRSRMLLAGSLFAVLGLGTSMGLDCQGGIAFDAPAGSQLMVQSNLAKLPADGVLAKTVLPPSLGPNGSLFGLLLEDDTQAFILGSVNQSTGDVTLTGIAIFDEDGNFVFQQDVFGSDRTKLTYETGDAIDVDLSGPNPRMIVTMNATIPPSVIVTEVDANGNVVVDQTAMQLEDQLNPNYQGDVNSRVRNVDVMPRLRPSKEQALAATSCGQVSDAVLSVVGRVCQILSFFKDALPAFIINAHCQAMLEAISQARGSLTPGSNGARILSGLRFGVGVSCVGMQSAVTVATNANPLGLFCLGLRLTSDGVATVSGRPLGSTICDFFAGDQDLGGLLVDVSSVQMELLDTGVQDGDEISITRNGLEIFNGIVTTGGDIINVNLARGLNHFEFIALNEGSLPPNTAQVTVLGLGANNMGGSVFSLSTGQVATMDIVRR